MKKLFRKSCSIENLLVDVKELVMGASQATFILICILKMMGRGGGQMVSVLAFNSDDPSSNPAESTVFFCKIV